MMLIWQILHEYLSCKDTGDRVVSETEALLALRNLSV